MMFWYFNFVLTSLLISLPLTHGQINKAVRDIKVNVTLEGNMHKKYHITGLTSQVASKLLYVVRALIYEASLMSMLTLFG